MGASCVAAALLPALLAAPASCATLPNGADALFRAAVAKAFTSSGVPGLTIAVASRERIEIFLAVGRRRQDGSARVELDDPFHLASMTKPMTATMIATLVDDGSLRWDETVAEAWPAEAARMNARAARITLIQLLEHRSGLAAFTDLAEIAAAPRFAGDARARRAAFAVWLLRREPRFRAGEVHYSNAGYGLAAAMAEQVTGQGWETLMHGRLFDPLQMRTCGFGWPAARNPAWPSGHRYRPPRFEVHDLADGYRVRAILAPAEDVSCSGADLVRFGRAWLLGLDGEPGVVRPETLRAMVAAPVDGVAVGWMVGAGAIYHPGGAGTFHGVLLVAPGRDVAVAAIANAGQGRDGSELIKRSMQAALAAYGRPAPARSGAADPSR